MELHNKHVVIPWSFCPGWYQQLQGGPGIYNILVSIRDSIEIFDIVCLYAIDLLNTPLVACFYFPMVILPSFSSVFRSSRVVFLHGTERDRHDLKSSFLCFWSVLTKAPGVNHMCNKKCSFFCVSWARWALNRFGNLSQLEKLDIFQFFDCAPWCFAERVECSFLHQIIDDWFGLISSLQLINQFRILVIRSWSLCTASCDTPWTRRSTWNESFSLTTIVFAAVSSALSNTVVLTCVSLPLQFPAASQITPLLQLLLPIPGIFENFFWSWPRWKHAIFVCQSVSPFSCVLGSRRRPKSVSTLSCSVPFTVSTSHLGFFLQFHLTRDPVEWRIQFVVLLCFPSTSDESCMEDWLQIEWASSVKNEFFPFEKSSDIAHQFKRDHISSSVSLFSTNTK